MAPSMTERPEWGFRHLIESIPAALYVADPGKDGRWHYVSPQIEAMLGYPAAHWTADPGLWWRLIHRDDRERVLQREERERRSGAADLAWAEEYRMIHRDGRDVWIRDEARLCGERGGAPRWRGMLSDVSTHRWQLEQIELELAATQRRLSSLLAGIEDHLGIVDETLHKAA